MTQPPLARRTTPTPDDRTASRYLFEHLEHGVAHGRIRVIDGHVECDLLAVNAAFTRITGLDPGTDASLGLCAVDDVRALVERVVFGDGTPERRELLWAPVRRILRVACHRPAAQEFLLVVEDIDEWKRKEADLRFHESLLRETGHIAKVGGWSFDPQTGEGFWTEEVARIHDLDPSTVTSRDIGLSFYTEESRQRVSAAIERAIADGTPYDLELELVSASGVRKWVRTIGRPTIEQGRVVRVHGSFQDISDRKRTEEALVQSELRHRMLVEHASDGIFLVSPGGCYEEINARFAAVSGHTREELLGRPFGGLVVPAERERARQEVARLRAGEPSESEWHVQRRDGGVVEVEVRARMLPDGRITGVLRDITQRKQAEADVRRRLELEAQLSKLAAATPGAMNSFRIGGDGKPYFPFASQGIEELTGFPPSQLATSGDLAFSRIPAADLKLLIDSIAESARTMSMWSLTFRHDHPTRGMRWIEGRSMPVREADGSVTWHGFMADVTERRELEEQLRQAQKMEAIGQLASGVAHDFNNLLTVIQGNASLLLEHGTTVTQAAREIVDAAERAASLTQQLLLFSRKRDMRAAVLDLNDTVERMTKLLQRILGEDITLRAECAARPVTVRADAGMIEQVMLNLAVNSRDAMPSGGTLTVTTSVASVARENAQPALTCARLRVEDTGGGIPPEVLPRIFEPFFTTKDVGKGTGLGLATVYAIVRQHGGTIDVRSEVGRGTTFDILLPTVDSPATAGAARTAMADSPRGHETVLVVEDEPAVRQLVAHLLERQGYRVLTAETGVRALEVFAQHRDDIDLLLTDMVMPDGLTGRTLALRLLAERPTLRVVYTSGYTADQADADVPLVRGDNFIPKPYQPSELARVIRAALDRP